MAHSELPIPPSRDLPPRSDTLCLLISLSLYAGDQQAAEAYLTELVAILGFTS